MAKETQIKLTKTRYRLGCLGVTFNVSVDMDTHLVLIAGAVGTG